MFRIFRFSLTCSVHCSFMSFDISHNLLYSYSRFVFIVQFSMCKLWAFAHSPSRAWWAKVDSNHRPHDYQSCALTSWAISPRFGSQSPFHTLSWWRWGGSNSWPPACKAGALPAELHPHIRDCGLSPSLPHFESSFKNLQNRTETNWSTNPQVQKT